MAIYSFIFVIHFAVEDVRPAVGESLRVDHKAAGPRVDRANRRKDNAETYGTARHFNFHVKDHEKRFLHIAYKDFSKSRHNVYVVCAGKVAKVFTDAGTRLLKMADFHDGENWLVLAVEHDQKIISYECATRLKDNNASFRFVFDRNSLPTKMALEKLNHTYSGKMAAHDIRTAGGRVIPRAGQLAELHEANSKKEEAVCKPIMDRRQTCKAYETIIDLSDEMAKLSKVNNRRRPMGNAKETGDRTIVLKGQSLFHDDNFSKSFLLNPVAECYGLAVILDAGSFYNEELKKYFIPLVLRIPRMTGLPIRRLQHLKIKNLFLESDRNADALFNQKIAIGPVSITGKTTEIGYKGVCILNSQRISEAVEMVQTKRVRFKVTCELSEQVVEEEMMALYGEHPLDTIVGDREKFTEQWKYSKLLEDYKGRHPHAIRLKHHKATILGYAQFDLSDLVHGSQVVSAVEPLFMHFPFERQITPFEEYIFEEHELQNFSTTLELSVRVGCLLNYGFDWDNGKSLSKYMTRVVIVCNTTTDMAQLEQFYKELLEYNKTLADQNGRQPSNANPTAFTKSVQMFSGYFVVCTEYAILFVEGTHGSLDKWLREYFPRIDRPKLLYDRMMIFKNPSYSAFYDIGGFYHVALGHPLETYLDKYATYLEGNVPAEAWQCLFKLSSTMQCTTLKQFLHYGLAADINELKQFNEEFGVFTECYDSILNDNRF